MSLLYDTKITFVEAVGPCQLRVSFTDGTEGIADLSALADDDEQSRRWFPDGDYSHLHDAALFAGVRADTDGIWWGSGTDPEETVRVHSDNLYGLVHGLTAVQMSPELYADHVVEAEPLSKYRVRIRFLDSTQGVIDLSDFAHRGPLFDCWEEPGGWENVRIRYGTLQWGPDDPYETVDFSSEMLYSRVTGLGRDEMRTARFARAAQQRLAGQSFDPDTLFQHDPATLLDA